MQFPPATDRELYDFAVTEDRVPTCRLSLHYFAEKMALEMGAPEARAGVSARNESPEHWKLMSD